MTTQRAKTIDIQDYKDLLRIDWDWGSTGIWSIDRPKQTSSGGNVSYESLSIPSWLVERFNYWTQWLESCESWHNHVEWDQELLDAYAFSLATDLKRFLGDQYYIEYKDREVHDDLHYLQKVNFGNCSSTDD